MSKNGNDKPDRGQDETEMPTRDARGRWLPGHCPNRKGRPKKPKKPETQFDQADLQHFGNTLIDVLNNGQRQTIHRRAALIQKMFEMAMKGKVSMQRFLYQEFRKNDELLAAARLRLDELQIKWIIDNPEFKKRDFRMPFDVELEMVSLRAMLHHYYPTSYPDPNPSVANDDEVDDS